METRPLSRDKRWRVVSIMDQANRFSSNADKDNKKGADVS